MTQTPSIGRIVHYKLSASDADSINEERKLLDTAGRPIRGRGNRVAEGDVFPAMIVRTWGSEPTSAVQLQVFLDGTDTLWATSRICGDKIAQFSWPEQNAQQSWRMAIDPTHTIVMRHSQRTVSEAEAADIKARIAKVCANPVLVVGAEWDVSTLRPAGKQS